MNTKDKVEQGIEEAFETVKEQRDGLKLKIHLASMEVRDEWDVLERQWQHLLSKKDRLKKELEPTVDDAHIAWLTIKDEIIDGYRAIRAKL